MFGPQPALAEIVLDRILTVVLSRADDLTIRGIIRELALADMDALSPHLRSGLIQQHVDMLDWWLDGSWRVELHRPVLHYDAPAAALSDGPDTVPVADRERQLPGGAPRAARLLPREDSVDAVTGPDASRWIAPLDASSPNSQTGAERRRNPKGYES